MDKLNAQEQVYRLVEMVEKICPNKLLANKIIKMPHIGFFNIATITSWKYEEDIAERCERKSDFRLIKEYEVEILFQDKDTGFQVTELLRSQEGSDQCDEYITPIHGTIHDVLEQLGEDLDENNLGFYVSEIIDEEFKFLVYNSKGECVLFGHIYLKNVERIYPTPRALDKEELSKTFSITVDELTDALNKLKRCSKEDIDNVLDFLLNLR